VSVFEISLDSDCCKENSMTSILHFACKYDAHEIVEFLLLSLYATRNLEYISIVNQKNKQGLTPLMVGVLYGAVKSVECLLKFGGIRLFEKSADGFTAIKYN